MNKRKYEFAQELNKQMQEKMFSKVSISDICETMDCSRQSFYYYFNTLNDCLAYYIKESFKNQIKEEYLISDLFNYFDNNANFVKRCNEDPVAKTIFWESLYRYVKRLLDIIYSKNIVEYLALYGEQKEAIISFYVSGLLEQTRIYLNNNFNPGKEKFVAYCRAIIGSGEDTRAMISRFTN
jgi:AcrR family transcriptional regulator